MHENDITQVKALTELDSLVTVSKDMTIGVDDLLIIDLEDA